MHEISAQEQDLDMLRQITWVDGILILCRARRARKTVDYTGSTYDTMIRAAIRSQSSRHDDGGASYRRALQEEPRSVT